MTPGRPTNCNQGKTSKSQVRRGTKRKNSKEAEPVSAPHCAASLVQMVKTSRGAVRGAALLSESPKTRGGGGRLANSEIAHFLRSRPAPPYLYRAGLPPVTTSDNVPYAAAPVRNGERGGGTIITEELSGHMGGGSQPCVDLLRKTIRAIDSRKLLGEIYCDNSGRSLAKQVPICM